MQSLWMILACAMFSLMGASIKVSADHGASLAQIVLFRALPSVVLLLSWAWLTNRSARPISWRLHLWRNVAGVTSMWLGFFALSNLPLSTAVSLNYTSPLFIAGWMLWGVKQRDYVRVLAVLLGFLGVLGVLRPSIGEENFFAGLMGLCGGALGAVAMMQVRQIGRAGESEWRTVLIFSLAGSLSGLIAVLAQGWVELGWKAWLGLAGVGLSGMVGQLAMTRAFGAGSALLTAALQYSTIIFAAGWGLLFWGDVPDPIAWAGMALVIGSGLLSTWRTYVQSKQAGAAQGKAKNTKKTNGVRGDGAKRAGR